MLMFLMIVFATIPVLVLSCVAFAGLRPGRRDDEARRVPSDARPALSQPHFFADEPAAPQIPAPDPIDVLLSQIERHVRLEQAAAETFLDVPTVASLHSRDRSPLN